MPVLAWTQRRFTRQVSGIGSLTYEERLDRLGLTTLQARRERGDMVETYKIITGPPVGISTWPGGKPLQKSERTNLQSELCQCGMLYPTRSNHRRLSTILRMLMTTLRTNFPVQDVNTLDQMMGSFC